MLKNYVLLLLLLTFATTLGAQTPQKEAEDDLDYNLPPAPASRRDLFPPVWYGTGGTLGFQSNGFTNLFQIGISPMVGYKLTDFASVGPRASVLYSRFGFGGGDAESFITWSAGAFGRAIVFNQFFAHVEYSLVNEVQDINTRTRTTRAVPFAGAGIAQGGGPGEIGFETLILFRLTQSEFITDAPFEIRVGINYNF